MRQKQVNKPHPNGLTPQQARFVAEYLKDFNATQAAVRAGYSEKTARQQASRLLTHVSVQRAVAPKQQQAVAKRAEEVNRMELSAERTKLEIARLAYFDPRKLFDADGNPIPLHKLDDDTAAAIAGLDVLEEFAGTGADRVLIGHVKKWKLADKNSALEKAAKIQGLFEKDNAQKSTPAEALREFFASLHSAGSMRVPIAPAGKQA